MQILRATAAETATATTATIDISIYHAYKHPWHQSNDRESRRVEAEELRRDDAETPHDAAALSSSMAKRGNAVISLSRSLPLSCSISLSFPLLKLKAFATF